MKISSEFNEKMRPHTQREACKPYSSVVNKETSYALQTYSSVVNNLILSEHDEKTIEIH